VTNKTRKASYAIVLVGLITAFQVASAAEDRPAYVRLTPVVAKILAAAPAFPGNYGAENVLKPSGPAGLGEEYASHGQGTRTFIDFDLGRAVSVAAFRHVQRGGPDTIAAAELVFGDRADFREAVTAVKIKHIDEPGATTFSAFVPIKARYVRWQVTSLLPGRSPNVGGRSIQFFAAAQVDERPSGIGIAARAVPIIERQPRGPVQSLKVSLTSPYAAPVPVAVRITGQEPRSAKLEFGNQTLHFNIPAADAERSLEIAVEARGERVASQTVLLPAARKLIVYMLPHSHTDIGFTAIQTDIEEKQVNNLLQGLAEARRTADYPEGARFVWNVEVAWAADLFLKRLPARQREEFFEAIRHGQVALNGMYLNELTGLCRPEELIRLFRFATQLGQRSGVPVDTAMISDVPGYTWGTVTAMSQAGIRYFSVAPNYFDRIGTILVEWENKPFWWIGPDGKSRVLVWIPFWGYAMSHRYGKMSPQLVEDFCDGLDRRQYPYDIAYVRWAGHGDNAVPDASICDFVKDWNATHLSPRFVIASTSEAFRAFENRYGDRLPQVRGDWTPYWEDGAGSSAAETAMNRTSSERLAQAEALWAMIGPRRYPAGQFEEAWKNVLLYSEHTWGAYCAISEPANPFTSDQWNIKQSFATAANLQSRQLVSEAAQGGGPPTMVNAKPAVHAEESTHVDIYNTASWPRTALAMVPRELSEAGDFVTDDGHRPVPAQRLASGELAVLVRDLPPLAGRRYRIDKQGHMPPGAKAVAAGTTLTNDKLHVRLDEKTGGIVELQATGIDSNLVDTAHGQAINDYLYLLGDNLAAVQRNGPVKITVRDGGPLVASLLVASDAPGCHKLLREVRVIAGGDFVELLDTVDKRRLEAASYFANEGKESVNFAFPFHVPGGSIRLDVPLGVFRPEQDQMPSACKNWLTVGRWADVSNADIGITWVTLDAPLVQVGDLTARLLNSQTNPDVWRKTIEPTQRLFVWAMNNHWGTNYRAYQEGPVMFRFVVRPHHGPARDAEASRIATGFSQPLVALPGRGPAPRATSLLQVEPTEVLVSGLKPSDDRKAIIVRLLNASDKTASARLAWSRPAPQKLWLSDTSELPRQPLSGDVTVPARGMVTVRAELPQ
jgi:alpha-mannosidase